MFSADVPGIGPIISSAIVAAIGTGDVSSKGRDFGAWLGLVPKQISTGDRTILGKISRRGNRHVVVQPPLGGFDPGFEPVTFPVLILTSTIHAACTNRTRR
jgi:transposase IS116/IS110/IS902 family protein